jgi:hypothetical protein
MPTPSADAVPELAYNNWRWLGIPTALPLFVLWRWLVNRRKADCGDNACFSLRSPNSKFMGRRSSISKRDQQLPRYAKEDRFDITIVLTVLP